MIEKLLDAYELKARVAPGLVLVFPILVDAFYIFPLLSSWGIFTASGVCGFALVYALSHVARAQGERIEPKLWQSWDGPPSTRFLRHRDQFFGQSLKSLLHAALGDTLSAAVLSEEEELKDKANADKEIEDAFRRVRAYLYANDAGGLWHQHNIEYGFSRNLLGCRLLWVVLAAFGTAVASFYGMKAGKGLVNPAAVMNALSLLCALYVGWRVLPGATKRIAEGYAELALLSFLRKAEESRPAPIPQVIVRSKWLRGEGI